VIKGKIIQIIITVIFFYLSIVFVISCIVSWKSTNQLLFPTREDIINYSREFLTNEPLIRKGAELDCSGFTSYVYKKFKITLPRSTKQQFNNFLTYNSEPNEADLVFFINNSKVISHVGIILNDSLFIHSPGKNKRVRIDNLNSMYWKERYAGLGTVFVE
jgi:amino acid permease